MTMAYVVFSVLKPRTGRISSLSLPWSASTTLLRYFILATAQRVGRVGPDQTGDRSLEDARELDPLTIAVGCSLRIPTLILLTNDGGGNDVDGRCGYGDDGGAEPQRKGMQDHGA